MKKIVDVLLATYNGEKYLREQIDSILNQTYKDIRLIISDDCSKDNTRKILKEYEEKVKPNILYERIKDKEYIKEENEYKYDLDKITIVIENKKVKKIIYDDFIIEYGG